MPKALRAIKNIAMEIGDQRLSAILHVIPSDGAMPKALRRREGSRGDTIMIIEELRFLVAHAPRNDMTTADS